MRVALKQYPAVVAAMEQRHVVYNRQMNEIDAKEENGTVFVIRPPESLKIGRTERDPKELERVYQIGRAEAERVLPAVIEFLKTNDVG